MSECLLWEKSVNTAGYGQFSFGGTMVMTHRMAWQKAFGPIPDKMCVLHKCDVRRCINPDHLFLGTPKDNTMDMMAKGRMCVLRGSQRSKRLTEADILLIRGSKLSQYALAKQFHVSQPTIHLIKTNQTWRHVS